MYRQYSLPLCICIAGVLLLAMIGPVSAGTVTISPTNLASTDISNLNTAISQAGSGGTVILNPGTYYIYGITPSTSITIRADTANGHTAADTIIDGTNTASSSIFKIPSGSTITFVLDNLTLQNGKASYGGAIDNEGGGSSPSTVTVTSTTFTGCLAGAGGAIYSWGPVIVTSSTFTGCTGSTQGGAIDSVNTLTVTSTTFTGCSATSVDGNGGAIILESGYTATVTSTTFTRCSATGENGDGGAIYNNDRLTVTSTTFTGCSATGSYGTGGAIYNNDQLTVISTTFTGCTGSTQGGAIDSHGTVTVTSSTFTGCLAGAGGAIILESGYTATVTSSTFTGCRANDGNGGAIWNGGTISGIQFCRFSGNSAAVVGSAIYNHNGGTVTLLDTWWGSNSNPSGSLYSISSSTYTPWLNLTATAIPSSIITTQTAVIRANLTYESTGSDTTSRGIFVPNGIPVAYSLASGSSAGSLGITGGNIMSGANTTVFSPSAVGTASISVTIDGQTVIVPVTVTAPLIPLTGIGVPTGTLQTGSTLTAGTVAPAGATTTLQWNESASSAGPFVPVSGATGSTYALTSSDIGKYIEVNATGTGSYTGFVNSTPVGPVTPAITPIPLTGIGVPTGTLQAGSILTAGAVIPTGATVTLQWNESASSAGPFVPISGATGSTYILTSSDLGQYIEVNATGTGSYTGFANSTPVGPVTPVNTPIPLTGIGVPTGTLQAGSILTAGAVTPAGATATLQWNESASSAGPFVPISGATGSTYILTSSDLGQYLEVNATGTGLYTGFANSTPVGPVAASPTPTPTTPAGGGGGGGGSGRTPYWANTGGSSDQGYTGQQPTPLGYSPATVPPAGTPVVVEQKQSAGSSPAVVQQTVAVPPAASASPPGGIPVIPIIAALAGIGIIGGGGFLVRRWWIHRQNPALFRKHP